MGLHFYIGLAGLVRFFQCLYQLFTFVCKLQTSRRPAKIDVALVRLDASDAIPLLPFGFDWPVQAWVHHHTCGVLTEKKSNTGLLQYHEP